MNTDPGSRITGPLSAGRLLAVLAAAVLGACASPPAPAPAPAPAPPIAPLPPTTPPPPPPPMAAPERDPLPPGTAVSQAMTPLAYRQDGARHIYAQNLHRIYQGKLPPLLQGVGVMQLDIDRHGYIVAMSWLRPPSHPGARLEIERTVRAAAPYPAPLRMGRVTYIDTWLWDKSGHFQLDTLTEGQRDR